MEPNVKQVDDWQSFWEVMALNNNPIAATDRPTVSFDTYQAYCLEIDQKLALNSADILLDIGCGTGLMNGYLSQHAKKVIATDYSFNMARVARQNAAKLKNVHIVTNTGMAVPFQDQTFSKVVLYAVTQYLSPKEFVVILCELKRITRLEGRILFGEIPRGRDETFLSRVKDVWKNEGLSGIFRKVRNRLVEITFIRLGRYTNFKKYVRPVSPPTWHPYPEELLALVEQVGMNGQILMQNSDLPWFHQTFDLLVINEGNS